ncbi:MAG: hypothetical protein GY730_08490 [bacterium]|nr:hypothetical protein [bacterium]
MKKPSDFNTDSNPTFKSEDYFRNPESAKNLNNLTKKIVNKVRNSSKLNEFSEAESTLYFTDQETDIAPVNLNKLIPPVYEPGTSVIKHKTEAKTPQTTAADIKKPSVDTISTENLKEEKTARPEVSFSTDSVTVQKTARLKTDLPAVAAKKEQPDKVMEKKPVPKKSKPKAVNKVLRAKKIRQKPEKKLKKAPELKLKTDLDLDKKLREREKKIQDIFQQNKHGSIS